MILVTYLLENKQNLYCMVNGILNHKVGLTYISSNLWYDQRAQEDAKRLNFEILMGAEKLECWRTASSVGDIKSISAVRSRQAGAENSNERSRIFKEARGIRETLDPYAR